MKKDKYQEIKKRIRINQINKNAGMKKLFDVLLF